MAWWIAILLCFPSVPLYLLFLFPNCFSCFCSVASVGIVVRAISRLIGSPKPFPFLPFPPSRPPSYFFCPSGQPHVARPWRKCKHFLDARRFVFLAAPPIVLFWPSALSNVNPYNVLVDVVLFWCESDPLLMTMFSPVSSSSPPLLFEI